MWSSTLCLGLHFLRRLQLQGGASACQRGFVECFWGFLGTSAAALLPLRNWGTFEQCIQNLFDKLMPFPVERWHFGRGDSVPRRLHAVVASLLLLGGNRATATSPLFLTTINRHSFVWPSLPSPACLPVQLLLILSQGELDVFWTNHPSIQGRPGGTVRCSSVGGGCKGRGTFQGHPSRDSELNYGNEAWSGCKYAMAIPCQELSKCTTQLCDDFELGLCKIDASVSQRNLSIFFSFMLSVRTEKYLA